MAVDWNEESLAEVKREIQAVGGSAEVLKADVSSEQDTKKIMDICKAKFGTPDIYFANAGIAGLSLFSVTIAHEVEEKIALLVNNVHLFEFTVTPVGVRISPKKTSSAFLK